MDSSENDPPQSNPPESQQPPQPDDAGTFSQQFQHQPISARVPERQARAVTCTGVIVLDSPNEFVLDFLQAITRPHQIVARVVMVPPILQQLITGMNDNLAKYTESFGPPMELPKSTPRRPSISEIYQNFKLPDDMLSGSYSNSFVIGHSPAEFFFDFITGFYPTAAVSSRIITAAPYAPRILTTLTSAMQQYRLRYPPPQP